MVATKGLDLIESEEQSLLLGVHFQKEFLSPSTLTLSGPLGRWEGKGHELQMSLHPS